ncbi:DUF882 domain-containing protein [Candidatus Pacearchaeota archaeon]|nr:DUF882 domain-containing protein [bacterium]MCK9597145.1 DUF882 domain-containing protein [Candidatus Pacearchaeota archaeon]
MKKMTIENSDLVDILLMTNENWKEIKYFKKTEKWGNPLKVHKLLIYGLDALRNYIGFPIGINCAYEKGGHTDDSYHYSGMAVDIYCKKLNVVDFYLAASRFDVFNGIGVYPHWNNPGLHLDIRPLAKKFDYDSRWMCIHVIEKKNDKTIIKKEYISLSFDNIKKYCL